MMQKLLYFSFLLLLFIHVHSFSAMAQSESDIVITEIMYNPPESGADSLEFIELYNKGNETIDLSGYSFSEGVTFTFPNNTTLGAGAYILTAVDSVAFEAFYGGSALQWEGGALSNGGEDIVLVDANDMVIDSVLYDDQDEWPTEADGGGSSLVLCDPTSDNSLASNWRITVLEVGMNGEGESVFAHPNAPCSEVDNIPPNASNLSVLNATTLEVNFSEEVDVTSATNTAHYTGLEIASIDLDASNESVTIQLSTPLTLGVFETLTVENVEDLAGNPMEAPVSFDVVFNNTIAELVITEILYNDPGGEDSLEFVELLYLGTETAQLGGYTFSEGVTYTFPTMTVEPNEYIVISKIPDFIEEFFGVSSVQSFGGLRNSGESIEIQNTSGDVIDFVDYDDAAPWPLEADGSGYSLNLCDVTKDNADPANWSISTEMDLAGMYQGVNVYATPGAVGCKTDVGIETLDGTTIDLFPNPVSQYLTVQIEGRSEWEMSIFNLIGQQLLKQEISSNLEQVDVSRFEVGVYFVHFQDKNTDEYHVERIVIK